MNSPTHKICDICHNAGKRRARFPLDTKFKDNYYAHIAKHNLKAPTGADDIDTGMGGGKK